MISQDLWKSLRLPGASHPSPLCGDPGTSPPTMYLDSPRKFLREPSVRRLIKMFCKQPCCQWRLSAILILFYRMYCRANKFINDHFWWSYVKFLLRGEEYSHVGCFSFKAMSPPTPQPLLRPPPENGGTRSSLIPHTALSLRLPIFLYSKNSRNISKGRDFRLLMKSWKLPKIGSTAIRKILFGRNPKIARSLTKVHCCFGWICRGTGRKLGLT